MELMPLRAMFVHPLPERNRQDVDEKLGADLPRALEVHYVAGIERPAGAGPAARAHVSDAASRVGVATGHRAGDRDADPVPARKAAAQSGSSRSQPSPGTPSRRRKRAQPATTSPHRVWTPVQYPAPPPLQWT